jgi:transcriptional regulator GlxA family with amidase domain
MDRRRPRATRRVPLHRHAQGDIDATLHVVDRFAGRATALEVARQIGYTQTGALDDPRFEPPADGCSPG